MIKKKNKVNIPLILCTVFIAVISCFACFSFNKADNTAYADSVTNQYVFTGSNNIQFNALISSGDSFREFLPLNVRFDLTSDLNGVVVTGHCTYYSGGNYVSKQSMVFLNSSGNVIDYPTFTFDYGERIFMSKSSNEFLNYGGFPVYIHVGGAFNSNVSAIELGTGAFKYLDYGLPSLKAFYIKYIDINNNFVYFEFAVPSDMEYNNRTYYLAPDFSDSDIYQSGYSDGYNVGHSAGENVGYKNGYNVGQGIGYNAGFSDGAETTNQYTFLNLLSATIDAPLTYFRSLFNFEILGFNLQDFLLGLFTICVVVTIFKMCRK